ncbi:hypothetical protein FRACYDRAFT_242157 [Fragilariopsis cylindrus CCMP1102]|uniref:Uncharacterized protein n=1 Tax=Fragilariopsis cylindrus CCMP1102 TaxID=635003 RepID=A0A1E7F6N1_9STRA|nr:hypothetical protein FRACYDRAFT_242157 [Fragilariopsis cylindrus CCMP1102]|eukprot:OEU13806.1 hypothetical protein FRACYDRAFT_242157 [Fragilariopsis cylindrus CCMP1102]
MLIEKRERLYQYDITASRLLSQVKHVRAWLVLREESQNIIDATLTTVEELSNLTKFTNKWTAEYIASLTPLLGTPQVFGVMASIRGAFGWTFTVSQQNQPYRNHYPHS